MSVLIVMSTLFRRNVASPVKFCLLPTSYQPLKSRSEFLPPDPCHPWPGFVKWVIHEGLRHSHAQDHRP